MYDDSYVMLIKELHTENKNDKIAFDSILFQLYKDEDYIKQHNTVFLNTLITCFVGLNNQQIESRIAIYRTTTDNTSYFGNFEALSKESGITILQHALKYCQQNFKQGTLIGPINGHTWNPYRLALNNSTYYFKNDLCNPLFYNDIMKHCGFSVTEQYETHLQTQFDTECQSLNPEFKITYFNENELINRSQEIYEITMSAFKSSPFFIAIPYEIFEHQFKKQISQIDLNLSPFVTDTKHQICAFSSCYKSTNGKGLVVKTLARKSGRQYAGLGRNLSDHIVQKAQEFQFETIIHAFMHQDNHSKSLSERFHGKTLKTYALYQCQF